MVARVALGALLGVSIVSSALAGSMTADEAKRFVSGKVFAFSCFDGTRGAGRISDDGGAAGSIQFSGSGPTRHARVPANTLQVRGQSICASLKGLPFEPCFNLNRNDERSFRGSVSGMGFAYCDFEHQGGTQMLMTRASVHRGPRSLRTPEHIREIERGAVAKVETPRVETAAIAPVRPAPAVSETPVETSLGLRKSTD